MDPPKFVELTEDPVEGFLTWTNNINPFLMDEHCITGVVPMTKTELTLDELIQFFDMMHALPVQGDCAEDLQETLDLMHQSIQQTRSEFEDKFDPPVEGQKGGALEATIIHLRYPNMRCYYHIVLDAGYLPKEANQLDIFAGEVASLLREYGQKHPDMDLMEPDIYSDACGFGTKLIVLTGDEPRGFFMPFSKAYGGDDESSDSEELGSG
jgi:hypothetical protein